ncbi:MAG: TolC family protein, partial [Salinisphaera sp.]|nr:TolC family protein [Salinisphaera sp.]
ARARVDTTREALRRITTVWFKDLPAPANQPELVPPQPSQVQAWVKRAFHYNPQYLMALEQADIAEQAIQVQQADYIPDVDLVLSYQDTDQTEFVFGGASNDTRIGLEATWTLFAGGRNISEVRQARAEYRRAQAQVEATRRSVVADVRNGYRAVLTAIRRVSALEKAIASAKVALKSVRSEFQLGARTKADVLDARRDLFAARIDHVQAVYDYLTAVILLKLNSGVLSQEDVLALDATLAPAKNLPPPLKTEKTE